MPLTIEIPGVEMFNNLTQEFITVEPTTLVLEHSLISISKWEAKWEKPFLSKDQKTSEEMLDYIQCMTLTQCVDPNVYSNLSYENIETIYKYIDAPMTATWFSKEENRKKSRKVVTSELIYYWMIKFGIPYECQKWHLNRLITLIRVCEAEERPPKNSGKSGKRSLSSRAALNAARKQQLGTRG